MLSSHAPPCLTLGITIDTKETRNTIPSHASIFGAETRVEMRQKISVTLGFSDNFNIRKLPPIIIALHGNIFAKLHLY
jgi:hypothetical protein